VNFLIAKRFCTDVEREAMEATGHHFSAETTRVAVELWKAKVSLKKIKD
jgi:hypothetical protein